MDTYEIIVAGQLDRRWEHRFEDLRVTPRSDGTTQIAGPVSDQAALHGVLARVRDLGLTLILVRRCDEQRHPSAAAH